ncbi:MAG: hypothetical protein ABSH07_05415 [Candidatus Dormibacteria bacterium]
MDLVQLLRSQARRYRCVQCGESMAECGINVLAQQGNRALVRVTCPSCNDENLLQIIFQTEVEAPDAAPDQPALDEGGEKQAAPITGDEILELHEILAGHAGPLTELLARR